MDERISITTFLFTDIEGSTRLWEQEPDRMRPALALHDTLARTAVEDHRGTVVKSTGDGLYAAFADALDAVAATLQLQEALADPEATGGVPLRVRCGLHAGMVERRDNDYFGGAVNRAARIMSAAHGGQVLLSQVVFDQVADRLPLAMSLRDLGAVRLKDLTRPERVYQVVHPQLRQDFPALRSLEATPNNLPQQLTSFVGRERALAEVCQLLKNARLLTLVGVGGLGKTRLSLQAGAETLDDFPDGVWFVELAPLADERLVPQAVASVLGVKEEVGRQVKEVLLKFVQDRKLLLILDNCEHLARACAELATDLLQLGPQVKVLASSRESLHVVGETTFPLSTLSFPALDSAMTVAALTNYEAVNLFVDRASAAKHGFKISPQNASAVTAICRRVDGIPLAIELAAARVRALTVETIAARLDDRFRLLSGGNVTALPRHQTLRACIDWSYDLLTALEQTLLRRLAVFAGGWTLEAAEAVGAGGGVGESEVLDLLTRLVEKSLVEFAGESERYRLLETVRQYGQERLIEAAEADQVRIRHLEFYVALGEAATPHLTGPEQGPWVARLELEQENILAAHAECGRAAAGAELDMRLVVAFLHICTLGGQMNLAYQVGVESLARTGTMESSVARRRALLSVCQLGYTMGRYDEARRYGDEALKIALEMGDTRRIVTAHRLLGVLALATQDGVAARRHLEQALALTRKQGDKHQLAVCCAALAMYHHSASDLDTAQPLFEEAIAISRANGDSRSLATGLVNLAILLIRRGADQRAVCLLLEALAIITEIRSKHVGQVVVAIVGALAACERDWRRAARFHGAAESQRNKMGSTLEPMDEAFLLPMIEKTRGALGAPLFAEAEAAGYALSYEEALEEAHLWLQTAEQRP